MRLTVLEGSAARTRVGVAMHKPCSGCQRSWVECGGGWLEFGGDGLLATTWRCDSCMRARLDGEDGGLKAE